VQFSLDCQEPIKEQRLHVLIIGVKVQAAEKLKLQSQVLSILGAEPLANNNDKPGIMPIPLKAEAFATAWLYDVLCDPVGRDDVNRLLLSIRGMIKEKQKEDRQYERWQNDVVLVYFQGSEGVDDATKKRYLKMSLNEDSPKWKLRDAGLPYDDMFHVLDMPGVQLMVLNVPDSVEQHQEYKGDGKDRLGVVRCVNPDKDDTKNAESAVSVGLNATTAKIMKTTGKQVTVGDWWELAKPDLQQKKIKVSEENLGNIKDVPLIKPS
jgi:hypothetical protein